MTNFPELTTPPIAIEDAGVIRLGSGCITGSVPSRRAFLSTAGLGVVAVLTGCQAAQTVSTAVSTTASQLIDDVNTITQGLAGILPDVKGITGVGATVIADIQAAVQKAQGLASQVASAVQSGISAAAPIVNQVAGVVGQVAGDIGNLGINVPSWVGDVVMAAKTLVPIALSLAGVALAGVPDTGMSAAQARVILKAAAARAA